MEEKLTAGLSRTPVVLLHGARQTGKTSLARHVAEGSYITLDDPVMLTAARNDPAGFVAHTRGPVILDEVQRAPELFAAIKPEVDRQRQPGRFLLTSSANILLIPKVSELQATGQMETLTLRPLSQGEIAGEPEGFIDRVFAQTPLRPSGEAHDLTVRMLAGGYPPARELTDLDRRAWFSEYVTTVLRDVYEMARIDALALRRLLALLAARAGGLVNFAELARSVAMPKTTVKRYFELLEAAFLVQCLPAWSSTDPGRRLIMAPKLFLGDTGMAACLLGLNEERLEQDAQLRGALLENFVAAELLKQSGWSRRDVHVFHLRTAGGQQVGFVLEEVGGKIIGIEVKASATIARRDFNGLRALAEMAGTKFHRGIILYAGRDSTGRSAVSSDPHLCALPVSALWESV
jgi:predicted AAA+ superfamily ATPase